MDPINRKLRILFIHNKYLQSAGGEDTTLDAEVALLESKGHTVKVLFFDNASMGGGVIGKIKAGLSSIYNITSSRVMIENIRRFRPDLIHVHNFFFTASPSVIIEANRQKIPVVVTLHNFRLVCANSLLLRNNRPCELCITHDFPWYGVKYRCYHNSVVQSAMVGGMAAVHKWIGTWKNKVDIFITPANFIKQKLLASSLNVASEKIIVKRHFVEDPGASPGSARSGYYLFVGRLSPEKGVDVLLRAWRKLQDERLIIVGDGPEKEQLVTQFGNLPNVEFKGKKPREEVLRLMKECRALVFPSICYEGLPITIIEAFSTGTPVIGSAMGAMQEMISHEKNGLLFSPGSESDLVRKLSIFGDYLKKGDYSIYENARKEYIALYHPDRCYESVLSIYSRITGRKMREHD